MAGPIISCDRLTLSNRRPFTLIAGPCQMQDERHTLWLATRIKDITDRLGIPLVFKASFDKANRTSLSGERGVGFERGIPILSKVHSKLGIPVTTDVHTEAQSLVAGRYVSMLQIPAFLCRQTDLLKAAAGTYRTVNIKKGQFLSGEGAVEAARKVYSTGNWHVMLTERGTTFGYHDLVVDMRNIAIMREHAVVCMDATHSAQAPGARGQSSGGDRAAVPVLSRAAMALGIGALFLEVHEQPDRSPSDAATIWPLDELEDLLEDVQNIDRAVKGR